MACSSDRLIAGLVRPPIPDILFVCHRIPYPPDKGDKIRAWHMVKHLATGYRLHLLSWIDEPADNQYRPVLERICSSVCLRPLGRARRLLRAGKSLLFGRAITETLYRDRWAERYVVNLATRNLAAVIGYSGGTCHYLVLCADVKRKLIDLVDVDSEKWRARAESAKGPKKWLYAREARLVNRLEQRALKQSDATFLVSTPEAELFAGQSPAGLRRRIHAMTNGVDTGFFDPRKVTARPKTTPLIVFTGAMDYPPNIDAVAYFAKDILPQIAERCDVRLWIVGAKPAKPVRRLAGKMIDVTGRVDDVRPYLKAADVVIAPLLLARGIQNKVLEAMAMARPVVATSAAATGIAASAGREIMIADSALAFASTISDLLDDPARGARIGAAARNHVVANHSWSVQLAALDRVLTAEA